MHLPSLVGGTPKQRILATKVRNEHVQVLLSRLAEQHKIAKEKRTEKDRELLTSYAITMEQAAEKWLQQLTDTIWWIEHSKEKVYASTFLLDGAQIVADEYGSLRVYTTVRQPADDEQGMYEEAKKIVSLYEADASLSEIFSVRIARLLEIEKIAPLFPLTQDFLDRYRKEVSM